ncbi:MAG: hypothetical protein ACE5NG_14005 [bacterium]
MDDNQEKKLNRICQRIKNGYYLSQEVAEIIAERLLQDIDWKNNISHSS